MLLAVRNNGVVVANSAPMTSRPSTAGRPPGSPRRTLIAQSRKESRSPRGRVSTRKLARGSSVSLSASPVASAVTALLLRALRRGCRRQAEGAAAAGRDELDDLARRRLRLVALGSDAAEVEHVDAVRDLHHVVHVVRDEHDADAVVRQPPYEVQHLSGLGDAERSSRLVEEDDLAVPEDG